MATEVANAEKQARNQHQIDAHVDRIAKALGFAPPPRARADTRDARNAVESERMLTFLGLVANAVDPSNAGKFNPSDAQALGGIQDGYVHTEAEQRKAAEQQREEGVSPDGADQEQRDLRGQTPAPTPQGGALVDRGNGGKSGTPSAVDAKRAGEQQPQPAAKSAAK